MANIFIPISAVSGGKKDLKLIVRVAHIWLIRDKGNQDDIIFMNMMLVDEKVCCPALLYNFSSVMHDSPSDFFLH